MFPLYITSDHFQILLLILLVMQHDIATKKYLAEFSQDKIQ